MSDLGWIIDVHGDSTRREQRHQPAIFHVDGEPVFEVWFWHATQARWYAMSAVSHPHLEAQGVVFFAPDDTDRLAEIVQAAGA